jgi:hypothetical protein
MDERQTRALTRRRLGGAVLLLAGIAVAVVVLVSGGDDKLPKRKAIPARIVSVPPLGLGFAHPTSWKRSVSKAVIRLRSPDGSVSVFFSSPAARPATDAVSKSIKAVLLKRFKPAKVVHQGLEPLGERSVPSFEVLGREGGKVVRALEMVDSTQYRTYAVTVVTQEHPGAQAFKEARAIIGTVRFSRPVTTTVKPSTTTTTP